MSTVQYNMEEKKCKLRIYKNKMIRKHHNEDSFKNSLNKELYKNNFSCAFININY